LRENFHGFIVGDKYLAPEDRKPAKSEKSDND